MIIEWYQISIVFAISFAIIELFTGFFIALGFCVGSLFVSLLQFIFDDFNFNRDSFSFAVVSAIAIYIIRRFFSRKTDQNILKEDDVNLY